jgi:hypothetical protein
MEVREFLGNPRITPVDAKPKIAASGWYYTQAGNWIHLECQRLEFNDRITIKRLASPDIAEYFDDNNAGLQRFFFQEAGAETCKIAAINAKGKVLEHALELTAALKNPPDRLDFNDGILHFDSIHASNTDELNSAWAATKQSLINLYASISIYLFSCGILLLAASLFLVFVHKTELSLLMISALSLWVIYFSRIAVLVMVDITLFPAINQLYLLPAFPIWIAASFTSLAAFLMAVRDRSKINTT